jgi:hypothetical protein
MAASAPPEQAKAQAASNSLEHMMNLNIYSDPMRLRKTGIVCTIGLKKRKKRKRKRAAG